MLTAISEDDVLGFNLKGDDQGHARMHFPDGWGTCPLFDWGTGDALELMDAQGWMERRNRPLRKETQGTLDSLLVLPFEFLERSGEYACSCELHRRSISLA